MNLTLYPRHRWCAALFALLACGLLLATPARADPPGRIGRVAWLAGTVSLQSATGEAFSAPLNQPLTSGDVLTLGLGSRAEIQIGSKTVRLDAGSVLQLDRIDDEQVRLFLSNGRAIAVLPTPDAFGDFEMATMNGRFTASEPGTYRFAADINGSSATVYSGRLRFAGDLAESCLKRLAEVKDSGHSVPGMGGFLDVVDSLLINTPLFYVFILWVYR